MSQHFLLETLHTLAELDFGAWNDAYIWRGPNVSLAYVPASHADGFATVVVIGSGESHRLAASLLPHSLQRRLEGLGWQPGYGFPAKKRALALPIEKETKP